MKAEILPIDVINSLGRDMEIGNRRRTSIAWVVGTFFLGVVFLLSIGVFSEPTVPERLSFPSGYPEVLR